MNLLLNLINKLILSSKYSLAGIKAAWNNDQSFRLECYAALLAIPLAIIAPFDRLEKLILILLMLLLLASELFNSAIEAVVDRISLEHHPLAKLAKDAGSAAVAMVILMNIIAWLFALLSLFF